jgi:hypothetical protein
MRTGTIHFMTDNCLHRVKHEVGDVPRINYEPSEMWHILDPELIKKVVWCDPVEAPIDIPGLIAAGLLDLDVLAEEVEWKTDDEIATYPSNRNVQVSLNLQSGERFGIVLYRWYDRHNHISGHTTIDPAQAIRDGEAEADYLRQCYCDELAIARAP